MLPTKTTYQQCPKFEKTFSILGKKWNGLIVDVLVEQGPLRFSDIAALVPQISDRVLVERLRELEAEHIIEKVKAPDSTLRMNYGATEKGYALKKALKSLKKWGEEWLSEEECS